MEGSELRLGSSAAEVQAVHAGAATDTDGIYYEYDALPVVTQSNTENYSTSHKKKMLNLENNNDKYFKKLSQTDSDLCLTCNFNLFGVKNLQNVFLSAKTYSM